MDTIQTQTAFLKRYQYDPIKDCLGAGGFGSVYRAYDTSRHREVAIKIAEVKKSETGKKIFSLRDEVMAVGKLPDHPNVAHYEKDELYTFALSNGVFDYAVMQYYSDGNLSEAMKKGLMAEQKEGIARQLLEGIAFLHKHKVVHRDLKPANILVVRHDGKITPVITDFGLSKSVDETEFSNSFTGGTKRYSAPEQLQGRQPLKFNVDLWSYGVIIYELFTGKPLFSGKGGASDSGQAEKEIYDKITKGNVGSLHKMPEKWRKVAERCLIVDSEQRAQNTDELFEILASYDEDEGNIGDDKKDVIDLEKVKKYVKIGLAAVAAVAIIVAFGFWLKSKQDKDTRRFLSCEVVNDYRLYLKDFPDGKHFEEASRFVESFVADSIERTQRFFSVKGVSFTMKYVEGGTFMMGSEDFDAGIDEGPVHEVAVEDFYIGETEVTQALWKAVMGKNPSSFKGDSLPVESVSWEDCHRFIHRLNEIIHKSDPTLNEEFRLPCESEWEYAAKGGKNGKGYKTGKGYKFAGSNDVKEVAWYRVNSDSTTHKVRSKSPNELGIYDMSGNVWEWCEDVYVSYDESERDYEMPICYVLRGGNWFYESIVCRVTARSKSSQTSRLTSAGLRLVLSKQPIADHQQQTEIQHDVSSIDQHVQSTTQTKKEESSLNSLDLGYGKWYGGQKKGKPDGKGTLEMTKKHSFGGQTVEAGTVMKDVLFENGVFVMGKICDDKGRPVKTILP